MKTVGLMTCFLDNYGACLQAYALQHTIIDKGYHCEIVKYTEPVGYYSKNLKETLKNSTIYNIARCLISKKYKTTYKFEKIRRKNFEKFRNHSLIFSEKTYPKYSTLKPAPKYDIFVCGSDQIWNPTFYDKCNPAYYLDFVPDNVPKISYAPSIGLSDIPQEYVFDFSKYLKRFDAISVREKNGVELIERYTGEKAKWVLDPTMLLEGKEWSELIPEKKVYNKPYIFCYLFGRQEYYSDAIERLQKETGLDVVIIPFSERDLNKKYHQVCKAGPIEFLSLIKNAQYVLTDSFHATVFSILFKVSFFTLLRNNDNDVNSMNSRVYSLLSMLDLEDRFLNKDMVQSFKISGVDNFDKAYKTLNDMRKESISFLTNSLEIQCHE